ncbi:MAG: PfkB family carbohydrate kinase [Pseudobdellovibrionaceae bacterium]
MSEVLVVGSLAYDSIKTKTGSAVRTLGGSANYFSLAASLWSNVRVVGVIGQDYKAEDLELLKARGVDLAGVEKAAGNTFFWEGSYEKDVNEAQTLKTELNVFADFNPKLPDTFASSKIVFLANIDPELQLKVLQQVNSPEIVGMDTMNFWISSKKPQLLEVVKKVQVLLINETEAKILSASENAIEACRKLHDMGVARVVVKRGEYGFVMSSQKSGFFSLPAMPIEKVVDPTGAGDTFAGGFFGYLASLPGKAQESDFRRACMIGAMTASFTIQDFGVKSIAKLNKDGLQKRLHDFDHIVSPSAW